MKLGEKFIVKKGTKVWSETEKSVTLEQDTEVVLETLRGHDTWCKCPKLGLINVHASLLKEKI